MNKKLFSIIYTLFHVTAIYSQAGCTDSNANNYNPSATNNNGSCTYEVTTQIYNSKCPLYTYAGESSGIVYTEGVLWTHNDSGNASDIFKVDTATGALLQKISIGNYPNNDWEDITADSNYIYVGDFGNNNGTRIDLRVLKIDKAQFANNTAAVINATAQAINFSYADQTSFASNGNNNYDCESLISINGSLYLFTKDRGDFQTRVYKLSKTPGTYTISPYTSYNVNGKITGADYNKQKNEVALIGYMGSNKNSFIYYLNDFTGDLFFSGNKRRVEIGNASNDWQTEGITYRSSNELYISCESSYTTATLYQSLKSSIVVVGFNELENKLSQLKIYPNPAEDFFIIDSENNIEQLEIYSIDGGLVYSGFPNQNTYHINTADVTSAASGYYTIKIKIDGRNYFKKLLLEFPK